MGKLKNQKSLTYSHGGSLSPFQTKAGGCRFSLLQKQWQHAFSAETFFKGEVQTFSGVGGLSGRRLVVSTEMAWLALAFCVSNVNLLVFFQLKCFSLFSRRKSQ